MGATVLFLGILAWGLAVRDSSHANPNEARGNGSEVADGGTEFESSEQWIPVSLEKLAGTWRLMRKDGPTRTLLIVQKDQFQFLDPIPAGLEPAEGAETATLGNTRYRAKSYPFHLGADRSPAELDLLSMSGGAYFSRRGILKLSERRLMIALPGFLVPRATNFRPFAESDHSTRTLVFERLDGPPPSEPAAGERPVRGWTVDGEAAPIEARFVEIRNSETVVLRTAAGEQRELPLSSLSGADLFEAVQSDLDRTAAVAGPASGPRP